MNGPGRWHPEATLRTLHPRPATTLDARCAVATLHRCPRTLTGGHRPIGREPRAVSLDNLCEQGLHRRSRRRPKYAPRLPRSWQVSQAKASFGVVCKPSARPTQVRTLDLPPIHPQVRHDTGAALRPERERSATPLALPLPRMQPRWLQVSGLARDGLRHRAAGLRRSSPSRNGPAVRDETSLNDATGGPRPLRAA